VAVFGGPYCPTGAEVGGRTPEGDPAVAVVAARLVAAFDAFSGLGVGICRVAPSVIARAASSAVRRSELVPARARTARFGMEFPVGAGGGVLARAAAL